MNATIIGLVVAGCIFGGAVVGLLLHRVLPERHLTKDTTDVVRLATGMLSVLASLVLGLLIATAKSSYDSTDHAVRAYAAELILLDETLRDFGSDAAAAREALRRYTAIVLARTWPEHGPRPLFRENQQAGSLLEGVRESIRALRPVDEGQKWLADQALQESTSLLRQRWLMIEEAGPTVQPVVVAILVCWVTLIFTSFGINAPRNATVLATMLVCSLAIGAAIFLILEMDTPFDGVLSISPKPMRNALAYMRG